MFIVVSLSYNSLNYSQILASLVKSLNFPRNLRLFMDNLGKNWQIINIPFCGYRRRLEIHYSISSIHQKCVLKPIVAWALITAYSDSGRNKSVKPLILIAE
jgi:hypothetical protein